MAKGLCVRDDGTIVVQYGKRNIVIPKAQYKANGYKPRVEELPVETSSKLSVPARSRWEASVKLRALTVTAGPSAGPDEYEF